MLSDRFGLVFQFTSGRLVGLFTHTSSAFSIELIRGLRLPAISASQAANSMIRGRPKTRAMPPFHSSATVSEVHDSSSISAAATLSCARPMKARKEGLPDILMAETTAVRMPKGRSAKMMLSNGLSDSLRNCLVTCSPKRVIIGAFYGWSPSS